MESSITVVTTAELVLADESVAVQETVLAPWADTVSDRVAAGVPSPVAGANAAPVQSIEEIALPPVVESSAPTEPVTGPCTNQPPDPSGTPPSGPLRVMVAAGGVESKTTSTGTGLSAAVPFPSCPYWLWPQHFTWPVEVRAQAWYAPVATPATPVDRPLTSTGVVLSVIVPLPSWP